MVVNGSLDLFAGIQKPVGVEHLSLCDVGSVPDARARMSSFLDLNIKAAHFKMMAQKGINTVRLPLGYWNLIDLPAGTTPNGVAGSRWQNLQNIMPPAEYAKWI